jgi:FAD/FMN-containing dehydrogenase
MAVCDDGVVIDLTTLKSITVDPTARSARAQAGVLWGELDASTQAFGLATTGGTMSRTGISGLTLGGGIGWLMRRHGLTIDNLESAEVVTAEGKLVTASERELPDLFWALRGGGGNFGVVTSFTYRLHPVGPMLAGPVIWALEDAPEILRRYGEFIAAAPRAVNTVVGLRKAPPAPFLPVELHRRPICMIAMLWAGDPEEGEKALAPMRNAGRPLLDLVAVRPYPDLQRMFDAGAPDGWHYYWKSAVLGTLDNAVIDAIVEHASRVESSLSYAAMFQLGGAVEDIDEDETAYSHRRASHNLNINGVWRPNQPVGERETAWTREFFGAIEPYQIGAYINFLDRDDQDRVQAAYGDRKYQRLADIKRRYDPDNIFQLNHNIKPSENRTAEHLPQGTIHI